MLEYAGLKLDFNYKCKSEVDLKMRSVIGPKYFRTTPSYILGNSLIAKWYNRESLSRIFAI